VDKKGWLDAETFRSGVALCQMIPGATAMQAAAYVGLKTRGVIGAGASFIGFGLPAVLLMLALAAGYAAAHNLPLVVSAFKGLQAVIIAIMANATLSFGKTTLKDWKMTAIAGLAAALFVFNVNPIYVILAAAGGGLVLFKANKSDVQSPVQSTPTRLYLNLLVILVVAVICFILLFFVDRRLFDLAGLMVRIDLLAFGGGYASVPLMFHEVVEVNQWLDSQTFMNGIILGQVTPGPIVITATFIGYLLGSLPGAIVATISIFLPSFIIVIGLSPFFDRLRAQPAFVKMINGVLCSFVGMLFTVTIRFGLNVEWNGWLVLLAAAALAALLKKVDIFWVVAAGAILSIILSL
jgi:chromate transporter